MTKPVITTFGFTDELSSDFDGDSDVDGTDFAILANAWASSIGDANWNPACDISCPKDATVGIGDLATFARSWLAGAR
jgi:hypothetical protein